MRKTGALAEALTDRLSSVRLTVVTLLVIAACSVVGTLLPQGLSEQELLQHYGPGFYGVISFFGLSDLYHSWWFRFLLVLLSANLVTCSLDRLPKTRASLREREGPIEPERLRKLALSFELRSPLSPKEVEAPLLRAMTETFGEPRRLDAPGTFGAIFERGRFSRYMVYAVHGSVILVLAGALVGSLRGFEGSMNVPEGAARSEVVMARGDRSVTLPFSVRCDAFEAAFYETGAPREYRSDLTFVEDGKDVMKATIRVNDPATFGGYTFYQSSYGSDLKTAVVELESGGKTHRLTLPFREKVRIPDTTDDVQVVQFREDLAGFGPALGIMYFQGGKEPSGSWVLVKRPDFHGNRLGDWKVKVGDFSKVPYTGLQVRRDPGAWVVWTGFTGLVLGLGLCFYTSHRKLWVFAGPGKPGTVIVAAGRTSKNETAFEEALAGLRARLERDLDTKREAARK